MKRNVELLRTTSKIVSLAKSGQINYASKLFDEMPNRDSVAWNAMLTCYAHVGLHQEALSLFRRMRASSQSPDGFTLTAALSACAAASDLLFGARIHALIVVSGHRFFVPVGNALLDMYGKCLRPLSASRVFEEMGFRNEVTWCSLLFAHMKSCQFEAADQVFRAMPTRVEIAWNVMISGYARHGEVELCLALFKEMVESSCCPDQCTFSALMNACSESSDFLYGRIVHCFIMKSGWSSAMEVLNSILSFYAELGCRGDVASVLGSFRERSQVSWNVIIDANMKLGDTEEALIAFQRAPEKGIVSWTSMISGYTRNGQAKEALGFFIEMTSSGIKPDDFSFGAVLHACSNLAVLGQGKMFHGSLVRHGFNSYVYIGNGLINMYAKCGDLEGSSRAFTQIPRKDLVSWNAMLFAFGLHGEANRVLNLYQDMTENGVKPDKVTFIGLFLTCSHSGLIEQCRNLFETMTSVHGIWPEPDHVACVVDMLGRGGYLAEARELADKYLGATKARDLSSYEALLGACSAHQEVESGTSFGNAWKWWAPQKEISYVLLSNMYCVSGRWKEAEMVRKAMLEEGVKKMPGCSWIEVRNQVATFAAGNRFCSCEAEAFQLLNVLQVQMRDPCFAGFVC